MKHLRRFWAKAFGIPVAVISTTDAVIMTVLSLILYGSIMTIIAIVTSMLI